MNRKGGVGKTATAQALGAGLIRKGFKALFVDLDSQHNLSFGLGAATDGITSYEMLTGEAPAERAIQETPQGDIIAGCGALAGADAVITGTGKEYRLREALGLRTTLKGNRKHGKIILQYYTEEELEQLYQCLEKLK